MRTRDEMLKDANTARNGYAYLKNSEDALPVRLGQDVTNLLAALAEKDAEIERLRKCLVWYMNHTIGEKDYYNDTSVDELLERMPT